MIIYSIYQIFLVFVFVSLSTILSKKYQYNLDWDFFDNFFVGLRLANTAGSDYVSEVGWDFFAGNIIPSQILKVFFLH